MESSETVEICNSYPIVLSLYGTWLAETLSDNPVTILEEYLEKVPLAMIITTVIAIFNSQLNY